MATEYFDCLLWKETKNGKKFPVRLGSAKKRDDGGFWVNLDAIPAPAEGQYSFVISPQKPREARREVPGSDWPPPEQRAGRDLDDEIPFSSPLTV